MHEIYMLAVLHGSRRRTAERTRAERLRDEQAFYELHGGEEGPRFRSFSRLASAVPVVMVAFAALVGLTHLPWR
jgi:hypothetical protein